MATSIEAPTRAPVLEYLRRQREAILAAEPGVRAGDPDAVHDMRVATRRLRATLRTFRPLFDRARTEPLRDDLRWLGRLLGAVRDGDVLADRLTAAVTAEPPELVAGPVSARIRQRLAADTAKARSDLVDALDGDRYAGLRTALDEMVGESPSGGGPRRLRRLGRRALRRADRRLDAATRATGATGATGLDAAPLAASAHPAARRNGAGAAQADPGGWARERDRRLHEARKAYKRARYAVEALTPTSGGGKGRRLAKRLSTLQDVLGEHQDAAVTAALLRDYGMRAYADGENAFTYGLLHARQQRAGAAALDRLDRARRRAGTPKLRGWLG
jgi:CHAD domain-containing protein